MSQPKPGTFIIYNRVLNSKGQRLALTFNGNKQSITVTPLDVSNIKQRVSMFKVPIYTVAVPYTDIHGLSG